MEIQHVILADYADIVSRKLYLMGGGWDTYRARETPVRMRLALAVGLLLDWDETDRQVPVTMLIEDDDGKQLARIEGATQVSRPAGLPEGSRQLAQLAANAGILVPRFGGYRVRIEAGQGDARVTKSVPFRVIQVAQGPVS